MSAEASPFGRYLIPPVERILNVVASLGLGLFARWQMDSSVAVQELPAWYRSLLLVGLTGLFVICILTWIIPATTVAPKGIRRTYAAKRQLDWGDLADFTLRRRWGARRVYAQLTNGHKYKLDGVPVSALGALRRQIGISGVKSGSWWLVDYSEASSTSSS